MKSRTSERPITSSLEKPVISTALRFHSLTLPSASMPKMGALAVSISSVRSLATRDSSACDWLIAVMSWPTPTTPTMAPLASQTRRGVQQDLDALAVLGEERELVVVRLHAEQGVRQHLLDRRAELVANVLRDEVVAHDLLLGEARDGRHLAVPLVDVAVGVDAEDGRVRRVDEQGEVVGDALQLGLARLELGDVLPDADDAEDLARRVAARGRVEEHLDAAAVLGDKGELKVVRLLAAEGVLEHGVDGDLVLVDDEVAHEVAAAVCLVLGIVKPVISAALFVPLVDAAVGVDADDGRVRIVDEQPHAGRRRASSNRAALAPLRSVMSWPTPTTPTMAVMS